MLKSNISPNKAKIYGIKLLKKKKIKLKNRRLSYMDLIL